MTQHRPRFSSVLAMAAVLPLAVSSLLLGAVRTHAQSGAQPTVLKVAYQKHPIQDFWVERMVEAGRKSGIVVEPTPISYEVYVQRMAANLLAPRGEYDIIWNNDDWGQLWGVRLEPLGEAAGGFEPFDLEPFMIDGRPTAAPFVLTAGVFFYRTDLIKPEEFPTTWDRLIETGQRLQREGKVKWGYAAGMKYPHAWFTILWSLWSNGADVFQPAYERSNAVLERNGWKSGATAREFRQTVEFWHDMIHKHKVAPPGMTAYTRNDGDGLFMGGDAAITMQDSTVWGTYNDPAKSKVAGKVGIARWPKGPAGRTVVGWADAWAWSIPKNSDPAKKAAAKRLIQGVVGDEATIVEMVKKTGGVPARRAVADRLAEEDPVFRQIAAATVHAPRRVHSAFYMPQWPEVHTAVADYVIRALSGPRGQIASHLEALAAETARIMKK